MWILHDQLLFSPALPALCFASSLNFIQFFTWLGTAHGNFASASPASATAASSPLGMVAVASASIFFFLCHGGCLHQHLLLWLLVLSAQLQLITSSLHLSSTSCSTSAAGFQASSLICWSRLQLASFWHQLLPSAQLVALAAVACNLSLHGCCNFFVVSFCLVNGCSCFPRWLFTLLSFSRGACINGLIFFISSSGHHITASSLPASVFVSFIVLLGAWPTSNWRCLVLLLTSAMAPLITSSAAAHLGHGWFLHAQRTAAA